MPEKTNGAPFLAKASGVLQKTARGITATMLAGMVLIVFSNVLGRYFFNTALAWSEEISRFMLIWLVWFGAVLAFIKNEHLGLDLVVKALPQKANRALAVLADLLVMYATCLIAIGGWQITTQTLESGWTSPAAAVPYGFVYLVVPICAVVLTAQGAFKLATDLRGLAAAFKGGAR